MEEYPAFAILKPVVVAAAGGGNVRIFLLRQIFPSGVFLFTSPLSWLTWILPNLQGQLK